MKEIIQPTAQHAAQYKGSVRGTEAKPPACTCVRVLPSLQGPGQVAVGVAFGTPISM